MTLQERLIAHCVLAPINQQTADLLKEAAAELDRLEAALNPREWDLGMSTAWHHYIPDTMAAFRALRDASRGYVPDAGFIGAP